MFITVRLMITMTCAKPITPRMTQRRSGTLLIEVTSDMRFTTLSLLLLTLRVAAAAGPLLLLRQAVGDDDLGDRCGLRAGPVTQQLAGERDPADRLAAGLDDAVKAGAVGLG